MGVELLRDEPRLFDRYLSAADQATGVSISRLCLDGDEAALKRTEVAQPAVFAISLALVDVAGSIGLRPDAMAGHSLGEYTAAVASGSLSLDDGMRIVAERGRLMAAAQSRRPGGMIAILGLDAGRVASLCEVASTHGVAVVGNLNAPTQVVVSGETAGIERVRELALLAGAEDVVPLAAGAAFHSPLMSSVRTDLTPALERAEWTDPHVPVVANVSGAVVRTGREVERALVEQIDAPLLWTACVATLRDLGCTTFVEIGPGRVLTGLARQIDPDIQAISADSPAKLQRIVDRLADR